MNMFIIDETLLYTKEKLLLISQKLKIALYKTYFSSTTIIHGQMHEITNCFVVTQLNWNYF